MLYNLLACILRALGDGKTPLNAMIVASFTNIALDILFVLVLDFGIAGAAAATLIAQLVSAVFCIFHIRKIEILSFRRDDFRFHQGMTEKLLVLGSPMAFQNGIIAVGGMIVQSVVNGFGVIFIAVILWLFSFSTFIGILFYARPNVAYLFGDNWISQTLYKLLALVMLFIGGLVAYTFVWDLGDVWVGLMTVFNMIALIPLSRKAMDSLKEYETSLK